MSAHDFADFSTYRDDDLPSVETRKDEDARERRWAGFEIDCAAFADSEPDGWAAVLRAVARAMKDSGH